MPKPPGRIAVTRHLITHRKFIFHHTQAESVRIYLHLRPGKSGSVKLKTKKKMLKNYETVFIMTPVLSAEQMEETVGKYLRMLTESGCRIDESSSWGLKRLQYPIQKKTTGFYHLISFAAPPKFVAELELAQKRDERLLRFLTVGLDRDAVKYNVKRRSKGKEVKDGR